MARPSGQKTMKPITISAMVAGVQAGRINAVVFIFSRSFRWSGRADRCNSRWEPPGANSRSSVVEPDKPLKSPQLFDAVEGQDGEAGDQPPKGRADAERRPGPKR